jgi:two-component system, response regulator YesN
LIAWSSDVKKNHMVEKFENLLLSNLSSRDFNMENALNNVALSEDHFRVLFKKETGKTPLQYLTHKRIEYAKMLLKTRNLKLLKILEVARMSGFDDPYYFSRVFKKVTGKSPLDWIKTQ